MGGGRIGPVTASSARVQPALVSRRAATTKAGPQPTAVWEPLCSFSFFFFFFFTSPGRRGGLLTWLLPAFFLRFSPHISSLSGSYFVFPSQPHDGSERSYGYVQVLIANAHSSFRLTMGPSSYTRNHRGVSVRFLRFPGQGEGATMRCEDRSEGERFRGEQDAGLASAVVRLGIGACVPPTLVAFRTPGEKRHCPCTWCTGLWDASGGLPPEERRRSIEAHDTCMLGAARMGRRGRTHMRRHTRGTLGLPFPISTSCLVERGKRAASNRPRGGRWALPSLHPAQASHCQGTPPPSHDTSHLTCSHRTQQKTKAPMTGRHGRNFRFLASSGAPLAFPSLPPSRSPVPNRLWPRKGN